ncbi:hypothetical protein HELRODRAFT_95052 [Helobdella robusta]|uniref:Diacylglycerol kinase n=1 Tax=Helobdella robusta TaxID=6412 RepID=T1G943_HELRO|nr:hypothetical protein HELRODRAFT_95052 [Helobdella robusta]ESN99030.1 hypothetical protein HELRODRAFT_95052 [Helobdella robusta]
MTNSSWDLLYTVISFFLFFYIMSKLYQFFRSRRYQLPAEDLKKGHWWTMVEVFTEPTFCNYSGNQINDGACCDCCGIIVADNFICNADAAIPCKQLSRSYPSCHTTLPVASHPSTASTTDTNITPPTTEHHWIIGNVPADLKCTVCNVLIGSSDKLCHFKCCWCKRAVHMLCKKLSSNTCDMGHMKDWVVPPHCIELKINRVKGRRRLIVQSVEKPSNVTLDRWKPLLVLANRKSGNGDASLLLSKFRGFLNLIQVVDLHDSSPTSALEWCRLLPNVTWRVLVAGGDGTVAWVLSAFDELAHQRIPQLCVVPLGTGNDLSRVLGWGTGHSGDFDVECMLQKISTANVIRLDRWRLDIVPKMSFNLGFTNKRLIINNYMSIGVDAQVALNFHHHREMRPIFFRNRFINKLWYFTYGTKDVLDRECKDLDKKLKLIIEDKIVDLPSIEGIVVLNISSWGGGCRPWGEAGANIPESKHDDKLFEVFALYSSFHIAQLRVGLAEPLRLGQVSSLKIMLFESAPMQADGEPWVQGPSNIQVSFYNQAHVLANSLDASQCVSQ